MYRLVRPLIFTLQPELAHRAAIRWLQATRFLVRASPPHAALGQTLNGLYFPTPIGLAAGFDKNAEAIDGCLARGFGFVEAGTVTPKPQSGNPQPRLFRLSKEEAIINRLGFNNQGLARYVKHFSKHQPARGIAGANIGKNKDSTDAVKDYVDALSEVYTYADYVTVNISSPNTPGLRDLQHGEALHTLLCALQTTRQKLTKTYSRRVPIWLKIAPDITADMLDAISAAALEFKIDALVISNTTVSRPGVSSTEAGGLSGKPLFALATDCLQACYRATQGKIMLVGTGGVASADDAYRKIRAGASLVQLYTALIYQGFELVERINRELPVLLARDGFTDIRQAIGADHR